jgi:hypothetical protein
MAERKGPRIVSPAGRQFGKEMSEKSPNPHGESKILEMPIRTQQRNETSGKNIPRVPNTIGGNLNPSVAHDFEKHVVNPEALKKNALAQLSRLRTPRAKTLNSACTADSSR